MPRLSGAAPALGAGAPGKQAGMQEAERVTPGAWERGCGRSLVGAEHGNARQEERDAAKSCRSIPDKSRREEQEGQHSLTLPGARPAPGHGEQHEILTVRMARIKNLIFGWQNHHPTRARGGCDSEKTAPQTKGSRR